MPPQKRDAGSGFGDGFFDDFRGTEEEEALFGSGDHFQGIQRTRRIWEVTES